MTMMNKLEKLLDLCIKIAEEHLEAKLKETHPMLPFPKAVVEGDTTEEQRPSVVKPRKARAPKTAEQAELAAGEVIGAAESVAALEDQLGIDTPEQKEPEMTEEESVKRMEEVTKQFVSLCKNDKPEDGKTRAIALMRGPKFGVQKLGELTHAQRKEWIKEIEAGILAHK